MRVCAGLFALHLVSTISCLVQPTTRFKWIELDFEYSSKELRDKAINDKTFIPKNNIPMGLEMWGEKLFITVPRKTGVPASLNYVNLNDKSTSPKLKPYPDWDAHISKDGKPAEIISAFRVRADHCDRLWVLDNGKAEDATTGSSEPAIIIYNLKTDKLVKKYTIPTDQIQKDSRFVNIAVEDSDCTKTYAYAADIGNAGIVVFSLENGNSWRITHEFFNPEPSANEFQVKGEKFTWPKAIFGMGISGKNPDGFHTLYFHPMSSLKEYSVSTEYLRNTSIAKTKSDAFRLLGTRIPNAQSTVSIVDPETSVLFYSLVNLNAVACWNTSNKEYSVKNQAIILIHNETMVYPSDVKVFDGSLLILTNNGIWSKEFDATQFNFRVFSAPVAKAIKGTACGVDVVEKQKEENKSSSAEIRTPVSLVALALISCFIGVLSKM